MKNTERENFTIWHHKFSRENFTKWRKFSVFAWVRAWPGSWLSWMVPFQTVTLCWAYQKMGPMSSQEQEKGFWSRVAIWTEWICPAPCIQAELKSPGKRLPSRANCCCRDISSSIFLNAFLSDLTDHPSWIVLPSAHRQDPTQSCPNSLQSVKSSSETQT